MCLISYFRLKIYVNLRSYLFKDEFICGSNKHSNGGVFPIVPLFEITGKKGVKFCGTIGKSCVGQLGSLIVGQSGSVLIVINPFL